MTTIFADRTFTGTDAGGNDQIIGAIVRPELDEAGALVRGQRRQVGMLVRVRQTREDWGRTTVLNEFRGVVVAIEQGDANVRVRPLCGPTNEKIGHMVINGQKLEAGRSAIPPQYRFVTVPRRALSLVHPVEYTQGSLFRTYAEWNIRNCVSERFQNWKAKFWARMAQHALLDRQRINYTKDGRTHVGRKEKVVFGSSTSKNPATWVRNLVMAKKIAVLMKKFDAAVAGDTDFYRSVGQLDMTTASVKKGVEIWNTKQHAKGTPTMSLQRQNCGHLEFASKRAMLYVHGDLTTYCRHCIAQHRTTTALDDSGEEVLVLEGTRTYTWEDGTQRINRPPSVIGSYHSSKRTCGKLPNIDGSVYNGLTMGMELEMECVSGDREDAAHQVSRRIRLARPDAWGKAYTKSKPGYAFLENDSSLDNGFEMVTSYGSLDVHRHHVLAIFGPEAGTNRLPFKGKLRSHDGRGTCGLHVHLAKPQTLMHAAKLQAFYNDPTNKRLVEAVARRYGTSYAKAQREKSKEAVRSSAKQALGGLTLKKWEKQYGYNRKQVLQHAMSRLCNDSRYEQVNLTPEHTVEIRVFKGSLLPTTIIACLEFAQASYLFTKEVPAARLTTDDFLLWISAPRNRQDTRFLRGYLAAKGFAVFQPNPNKGVRATHDTEEARATLGEA